MSFPFTRFQHPDPGINQIVQDLYDKLAAINTANTATASSVASSNTQVKGVQSQVNSLFSQLSALSAPQTPAISRLLTSLPSNNPNATDPALRDGALVEYAPVAGVPGVIYRYSLADLAWQYLAGALACPQSTLASLGLGSNDVGFLVEVTDYNHMLRWDGSAWGWAPGDSGSGYVQSFLVDPTPTTGWHLLDGAGGVTYLNANGTTSTQNLPDLVSAANKAAYLKFGSPSSATATAAVAPTLTMDSYTPAGTNSIPVLAMNSYTPAGTISTPTFTGSALATHQHEEIAGVVGTTLFWANNPFGTGSNQTVNGNALTAGGSGTFAVAKTSAVSGGTPAGTVSTPTFTGSAATLTGTVTAPTFTGTPAVLTGTISNTGEPRNLVLRPWFRL